MAELAVRGADQLRAVGADLRRAGSPGRGVRAKLRTNLRAAAEPVKLKAQQNVLSTPSGSDLGDEGVAGTGLRADIAQAIKIQTRTTGTNPMVRVWVNPRLMRSHPGNLAGLVEGVAEWRHPVYGDRQVWVTQGAHPYMAPAEPVAAAAATKAAIAAIDETAAEIERGI